MSYAVIEKEQRKRIYQLIEELKFVSDEICDQHECLSPDAECSKCISMRLEYLFDDLKDKVTDLFEENK